MDQSREEQTAPADQVCILFADVSDSTALFERAGDVHAREVICAVLDLAAEAIHRDGGRVVKTIGDAILAEFSIANDAVAAAIAVQKSCARRELDDGRSTQMHLGIHRGSVLRVSGNDLVGDAVNTAARVTSFARADQILITDAIASVLPPELSGSCRRFGDVEVKGKQRPVPVLL